MRVQIAGYAGMLGHAVMDAVVRRGHDVEVIGDITDILPIEITGEVVINCAGIVKGREDIPTSEYIRVNGYGPHHLAEACDSAHARLIHVSTDCVFNDHIQMSKSESSRPTPNDTYSISKLSGEVTRWPHLTVRTSFIGWGKRGLLYDLYTHQGSTRTEYTGQRWSGHTVETVADVLVTLIARDDVCGILHVPGEFQTRAQLVRRLSKRFNLGIIVNESYEKAGYDRRLASDRWEMLSLPTLDSFDTQLERMADA